MVSSLTRSRPVALVSAPAPCQGKTLVTAALARAWHNQGLRVQAFKCGPDFLDPMILEVATSRHVYNLNFTISGENNGKPQPYRAVQRRTCSTNLWSFP